MPSEKSLAIVLRVVEFSESSCVVTLLTEQFGKIGALAKGARRPKSAFESALDLLAVCRIVFLRKSGDVLDLLTEARLERRFRSASRDLARLYSGYYVAELLNELTETGDPHPQLFQLADQTLARLDDGESDVARTVLRFELWALELLGHLPSLEDCVGCGTGVKPVGGHVAFGFIAGGVLCSACRPGQRHVASVTCETLDELRRLARSDFAPHDRLRPVSGEPRALMNQYLCSLLGKRPRLHAYLAATGKR